MKKILYIFVVLLVSVTAIACGKEKKPVSNNNNKATEVKSDLIVIDRTVDEFQFTNASLIVDDNSSTFKVLVTNTSENPVDIKKVVIKFYDNESNVIASLDGMILGTIDSKETKMVSASHYEKLDKAYSLGYEIVK